MRTTTIMGARHNRTWHRAWGLLLALAMAHSAQGVNLYWDSDGTAAGGSSGTTANGTWGTDSFWNTLSTGGAGTFTNATTASDDLFFSAGTDVTGASTITVNGTQVANSITVEEGQITLTGGIANVPTFNVTGVNSTLKVGHNNSLGGVAGNVVNLSGGGNTTPTKLQPTVGGLEVPNNMTWNGYIALGAGSLTPFKLTGNVTLNADVIMQPETSAAAELAGNISGNYKLTYRPAFNTVAYRLSGDNKFTGGFDYNSAVLNTLEVARDTAFGTGLVKFSSGNTITLRAVDGGFPGGAVRTYANDVTFNQNALLHIQGHHTFSGQATLDQNHAGGQFNGVLGTANTLSLPNGLAELNGPRTLTLQDNNGGLTLKIGPLGSGTGYTTLATVPPNRNHIIIVSGNEALGTDTANTTFGASATTLGLNGSRAM